MKFCSAMAKSCNENSNVHSVYLSDIEGSSAVDHHHHWTRVNASHQLRRCAADYVRLMRCGSNGLELLSYLWWCCLAGWWWFTELIGVGWGTEEGWSDKACRPHSNPFHSLRPVLSFSVTERETHTQIVLSPAGGGTLFETGWSEKDKTDDVAKLSIRQ